ncbi:MAG: hypothetical protein KDB88_03680 [Flavobacteriales bacterium]|nr:hypothetical protein [Flavobacteriales bacterium]
MNKSKHIRPSYALVPVVIFLMGSALFPRSLYAQNPACGSTNVPSGNLNLSWANQGPGFYYEITMESNIYGFVFVTNTSVPSLQFFADPGHIYTWGVRFAPVGTQDWSGFFDACTFATDCGSYPNAPACWVPTNYDVDPSSCNFFLFFGNSPLAIDDFELELSTDPSFPGGQTQTIYGSASFSLGDYSSTINVSNLAVGTKFFYRARAINDCGSQSPWSSVAWFHTRTAPKTLNLKLFLKGPLDATTLLMSDGLRTGGLLQNMGISPSVLSATGANAIVDEVLVWSHDPVEQDYFLQGWLLLVQRDGDIVTLAGNPLTVALPLGNVAFSFHHRNHLPVYVANPINANASSTINLDITQLSTPLYGTQATATVNGRRALWPGDVNSDGQVKYAGVNNDRDVVLSTVGGSVPTATITGQLDNADLNMDGVVKYAGANNDRDVILQTIGGSVPTAVRTAQVPF